MIKGKIKHKDGRDILFIGINGENVTRIIAQEPMLFDTSQLNLRKNPHICIFYGKDDEDLKAQIKENFGIEIP